MGLTVPRKRKFRAELLENGTLTNRGMELGRIDLVDGVYVINEPALYKWLMSTQFANGVTPATKINMVFGPSGGYSADPVVTATLYHMKSLNLVILDLHDNGEIKSVRPIATISQAKKKLEPYTTRAEQLAGLEPLKEED